jgi:hypothetical protein
MVVAAQVKSQIQQNVVKNVTGWDRFIKTVKRFVLVQGTIIVLRADPVKQRVGFEAEKSREA